MLDKMSTKLPVIFSKTIWSSMRSSLLASTIAPLVETLQRGVRDLSTLRLFLLEELTVVENFIVGAPFFLREAEVLQSWRKALRRLRQRRLTVVPVHRGSIRK